MASREVAAPEMASGALQPGDTIFGRYRIDSVLGVGSISIVYKAQDQQERRTVIIKQLRDEHFQDASARARFLFGSRTVDRFDSSGVVQMYDALSSDDAAYLVLEHMPGGSLAALLKEKRTLPFEQAVAIALQIASTLKEPHAFGIVHRAINTGNILFDATGAAKLGGFGMVDVPSSAFSPDFSLPPTEHSPESLQNLVYLAPEQLLRKKVDGRCDVYALSAVLHRMLTGEPPLDLRDARDVQEAQHIILAQQPQAPSVHNAEVPAWLDSVVLRALQKYPRFRFDSIDEMHDALQAQQLVSLPQSIEKAEAEEEALHRGSAALVENQKRWKHRRDVLFDVFKGAAFGACGGFVLGILTYGVRVVLVGLPQVMREGAFGALMLTIVVAAAVGAVIGWLAQSNE